MLVLPIESKKQLYNVEFHLKDCELVKESVSYDDAGPEEIIAQGTSFKGSVFDNNDEKAEADFLRSSYLNNNSGNNTYLVTTKYRRDKNTYNVYRVVKPTRRVNDSLEVIYSKAIRDLRKSIASDNSQEEKPARGRYLSLNKIGLGKNLSPKRIATVKRIVESNEPSKYDELLKASGVYDLKETVDFFNNNFSMKVKKEDTIDESIITQSRQFFSKLSTKEYKNLNKYYETVRENTEILSSISYISKLIYKKPIKIQLQTGGKELVKKKGEVETSDKN